MCGALSNHEGEVLEVVATKRRDRKAALRFLKRAMKRYGGGFDRHGQATVIPGGDEGARQRRLPRDQALAEQPGRKLTSALSKAGRAMARFRE